MMTRPTALAQTRRFTAKWTQQASFRISAAAALLLGTALFSAVASAQPRPAPESAPTRASVERLLSAVELSTRPADLVRLGPGTGHVLVEIARDPATRPIRRLRALAAIAFVPSEEGRALCREVIARESSSVDGGEVLDVGACAHTLGVFGKASLPDLLPLLHHASAEVRTGAIRGLAATRAPAAERALRAHLPSEPDAEVQARLRDELARFGGRGLATTPSSR
jgi:hypothetical protein